MKQKSSWFFLFSLILLCMHGSFVFAAEETPLGAQSMELSKSTVAVLPVLNLAGVKAEKEHTAQGAQERISTWLTSKGCTVIEGDKVTSWFSQNNVNVLDKEERTKEALTALGKQLGCTFVVSAYIHDYKDDDHGMQASMVYMYIKILDVAAGEYRVNGIFSASKKRGSRFTSFKKVKATVLTNVVNSAMEGMLKPVSLAQPATAANESGSSVSTTSPVLPAAVQSTEVIDSKLVVILPTINQTGKDIEEMQNYTRLVTETLGTSFSDCGFTVVPAAQVDKYLADNKVNLADDETRTKRNLAAIGSAFNAGFVVCGALQPFDNTVGMTFLWAKKRARAYMQLQIVDVQKANYAVNSKFTDTTDSSPFQGGAFEKSSGIRAHAVKQTVKKSVVEFLKPYQLAKEGK